jgi:hypothetical protein
MKKSLVFLLIIISALSFGQNYKLFNAGSRKVFATYPAPGAAYSMAFDIVTAEGNDSIYHNFCGLDNTFYETDSCMFWGGPVCTKQTFPSWLGKKVMMKNNGDYRFITLNNDTLNFAFPTHLQDTSLFFSDNTQHFSIILVQKGVFTLGVTDSFRLYSILHTNNNGIIMNSPLQGATIFVFKPSGLNSFFQIDSFPQVLKPLSLYGDGSLQTGLYRITNEMVYQYQSGDKFQHHEYYHQSGGPPWNNYDLYRTYTIIGKTVSADSLIYDVQQSLFYADSNSVLTTNTQLRFLRNQVLAELPYEKFNGITRSLSNQDYCGLKLWTYSEYTMNGQAFCAADTCWGTTDTGGPPLVNSEKIVLGLGIYDASSGVFGPPPMGYGYGSHMVYFKKGSVSCGNEVVVGIENIQTINSSLKITPNPATGNFFVSANAAIQKIIMLDISGRQVLAQELSANSASIDISRLKPGTYFAQIWFSTSSMQVRKVLVY